MSSSRQFLLSFYIHHSCLHCLQKKVYVKYFWPFYLNDYSQKKDKLNTIQLLTKPHATQFRTKDLYTLRNIGCYNFLSTFITPHIFVNRSSAHLCTFYLINQWLVIINKDLPSTFKSLEMFIHSMYSGNIINYGFLSKSLGSWGSSSSTDFHHIDLYYVNPFVCNILVK